MSEDTARHIRLLQISGPRTSRCLSRCRSVICRPIGWPESVGDTGVVGCVDFTDDGGVAAPCGRRADVCRGARVAVVHGPSAGNQGGRRIVRTFRKTGVARVLFGRFSDDVLDDGELDSMILMPTFVLGCGLCLTAIFLLGYEALT